MTTGIESKQILALLYLASPALPIGAFAYSQGLESAIESGRVKDQSSLSDWCTDLIEHGFCQLDIPVLVRLRAAIKVQDSGQLSYWNSYILASRESKELFDEELQLGQSLLRLVKTQNLLDQALDLPSALSALAGYALLSTALALEHLPAALALVWSWLENQVMVACKTIPLGQSDAQRVLLTLRTNLEQPVLRALALEDAQIGGSLPGQALLSALHETQYSRLFRS